MINPGLLSMLVFLGVNDSESVMYSCVQALAMLAALMQNSSNVEMVEYLMAAFWILLRNSGNRDLLSEAFAVNPLEEDELNKSNAEKEKGKKVKEQLKVLPMLS